MKDKFNVYIYKDDNFRKDDFAFTWEDDLEYDLVYGLDLKTKEPVYDNLSIKVTDLSNFERVFYETKIDKYYKIAFLHQP